MSDEMECETTETSSVVVDDQSSTKFLLESNYLRSIFPEEVWIAILERVQQLIPEDLENWSNSSPYFRHLLADQRVNFLFPKIFDIMAPKYEQRYPASYDQLKNNCYREDPVVNDHNQDEDSDSDTDDSSSDDENFSSDRERIPAHEFTGIMKCRLVCRSWNKSIQNYFDDPKKSSGRSHFGMQYDQNKLQTVDDMMSWDRIDLWKNCRFDCNEPIASPFRFLAHFEETHYLHKNPFMGRSVFIQTYMPHGYANDGDMQLYFNGIDQVFRNYGEEVWYCTIEFNEDETDPRGYPQLYLRLRQWISLMPNLKCFKIIQEMYPEDDWDSLEPLYEFMPPLLREIQENPLPTLEHLEFLSVKDLLAPMFNELIYRNGHLVGLEMEREEAHENIYKYDFDHVLSSMPNLKRLAIHSFTEKELVKLEEKMGDLHLEKFQLTDKKGRPFHWGRFLGILKGSSGTLTDLVLELPFIGNKEGWDLLEMTKGQDGVVQLEKLERLVLFIGRPLFLDWLLQRKDTLKLLELVVPPYLQRVKGYDKVVGEQGIELLGFEKRMKESNIWKVFGSLETVKIGKGYLSRCGRWKEFTRPLWYGIGGDDAQEEKMDDCV